MLRLLVVVDEVHASDLYMERLLRELLKLHRGAGGYALLMSATLGSGARHRLLGGRPGDAPGLAVARHLPYPALHTGSGSAPIAIAESGAPEKRVSITLHEDAENIAPLVERAIAAAAAGARVLVIRNRVDDACRFHLLAEAVAAHLLFRLSNVTAPHHGRFAPEDRRLLDHALEMQFGKNAEPGGRIVVTTQTAEQSLDIDADLLITDLCPMDVLLQRIGRLHRHAHCVRPHGFWPAPLVVIAPSIENLSRLIGPSGIVNRSLLGLGKVYPDLRVLAATRGLLSGADRELSLPHDCRALVEDATHEEALAALVQKLGGRWAEHAQQVTGSGYAKGVAAAYAAMDWQRPPTWDNNPDERFRTRLGLDSRLLDFPEPQPGAFGKPIRRLGLPGWMARDLPADVAPATLEAGRAGLRFSLNERLFQYDRFGLHILDSHGVRRFEAT
jgi:CRISPR-associated endonuclease/helicase Cas3